MPQIPKTMANSYRIKHAMPKPIQWPRADPAELAKFDPATKYCDLNCGQSTHDPRLWKECLYLCDLCGEAGKEKSK